MKQLHLLLVVLIVMVSACGSNNDPNATSEVRVDPNTSIAIPILYSPEKEDWMKERISTFNAQNAQSNGKTIVLVPEMASSGAARTDIKVGKSKPVVWAPAASTWLRVLEHETGNPAIAESDPRPLILTPIIISMWKPMAEALGWPSKPIGWKTILGLINEPEGWGKFGHPEWGHFSWGHTDPEISTSALSTVLAELYVATNKTNGLTVQDVQDQKSQQFLNDLAQGVKHYGYNTSIFSDNMFKYGMTYISAFPMEESTLVSFNKQGPRDQLVAIYPEEGTFIHDNPFIIMASATADEKAAAQQFYEFLLNEESQRLAMSFGFRPANVDVPLAEPLTAQFGVDPQQPRQSLATPPADVIVAAKDAWAKNRKPANIMIVFDSSGSMRDEGKMDQAKNGVDLFLGRLPTKDSVGLIAFSDAPQVLVPLGPLSDNMLSLQSNIQGLIPNNKTSLYDAIDMGRQELEKLNQPERINALIVLSDGEDTISAITLQQMKDNFGESSIQIFPIAYGSDASLDVLQDIADFSRTQLVTGGTDEINTIFENLSRYF